MRKIFAALLALSIALLPVAPASADSILLNGQKHYYTVQLRSDKRTIVYARIIFENTSADKDLSKYEFTLPKGVTAENLSVQQILAKSPAQKTCKTYETIDQWRIRLNKGVSSPTGSAPYEQSKQCLEYATDTVHDQDFNYDTSMSNSTGYYSYSYYQQRDNTYDYADLSQTHSGGDYTVTLSEAVKPKKQGSVLISFTTNNFVSGGLFGRYSYNVRTLLTKQMVDKATVAVNFDEDMYTREAKQKRAYESQSSSSTTSLGATADANYSSKSTDTLIQSIGRGGLYVKSQSSLLPGDTLSVTGIFATNETVLHGTAIITGISIIAVIIAAIIFYRSWRKKHPRVKALVETDGESSATSSATHRFLTRFVSENKSVPWLRIILTSVASIVGTVVITIILSAALNSYQSNSSSSTMLGILPMLCAIVVVLFSGIIAPMLAMLRYGTKATYQWSLVHVTIIVALLLIFGGIAASLNSSHSVNSGNDYGCSTTRGIC